MFDVQPLVKCGVFATLVFPLLGGVQSVRTQVTATPLPRFEDFRVAKVFNRIPHPPILTTPQQRLFRTRIREGVETGWGVWINGEWTKEQKGPGANFAGHYIVIFWGCGSGCIRMVMTDAETGAVYAPPISEGTLALPLLVSPDSVGRAADVQFRKDSRLMIVRATPHADRRGARPYTFYFLWQLDHWILLRKVPVEAA